MGNAGKVKIGGRRSYLLLTKGTWYTYSSSTKVATRNMEKCGQLPSRIACSSSSTSIYDHAARVI